MIIDDFRFSLEPKKKILEVYGYIPSNLEELFSIDFDKIDLNEDASFWKKEEIDYLTESLRKEFSDITEDSYKKFGNKDHFVDIYEADGFFCSVRVNLKRLNISFLKNISLVAKESNCLFAIDDERFLIEPDLLKLLQEIQKHDNYPRCKECHDIIEKEIQKLQPFG